MKKIMAVVLITVMLCGMFVVPVGATWDEWDICNGALIEAYDSDYIQPFNDEFNGNFGVYHSNVGKTYLDGNERYDSTFVYESIASLWQEYALDLDDDITKSFQKEFTDGKWDITCLVYPTDILEWAYNFKFDIDLWDVLNNCDDAYFLLSADEEYVVIRSYGRGERMPGASPVIEDVQVLSENFLYCSGYLENVIYTYEPSSKMVYMILEKGIIADKEIVGYRYLGTTPPGEELLAQYGGSEPQITVALNYFDMDNCKEIQFDQPPILVNDRTLVPMRAIFEAMGCEVYWNEENQAVDVWRGDYNVMTLWIGDNEMWTPSDFIWLDVPPQVVNDRTLVPVRAVSESMGAKVEWHEDLNLVNICYYPPYSGTTVNEYYYRYQQEIINFGYFLNDNPYWTGWEDYFYCGYYYSYSSESDIDYCIDSYMDAMKNEGFKVEFIGADGGADYYEITGYGYKIRFINDYLLEHIQVEIDIADYNNQQIIEDAVYQMASESSVLKMFGEPDRKEAKRQEMHTAFYYQNWVYDDLGISFRMCSEEKESEQYVDACTILEQSDVKLVTGIGIGSHKDEILETYSNSQDYGDRVSYTFGGGGEISFALENDCVSSIYVGYIAE